MTSSESNAVRAALCIALVLEVLAAPASRAQNPVGLNEADDPLRLPGGGALPGLPIREATIFKDGHAFVLHRARLKSDARGEVVLHDLPAPVLGTFWPFVQGARLQNALATRQSTVSLRPAQSVSEMLKANVGAPIIVIEPDGKRYEATILGVPTSGADAPPDFSSSARGQVILLQTGEGVRVSPLSSIQNVIFKRAPQVKSSDEALRSLLKLKLDTPNREAEVGVAYLQRGLRWIPNYRLQLGSGGRAEMRLQATLVNDLADLENVSAHLVVGVPSFAFRDTLDPISLRTAFARLSPSLGSGGARWNDSVSFSNAIQSQVASSSYRLPEGGPSVGEGVANEDFFLFDVANLSLKKGERSVFEVARGEMKHEDVYVAQSLAAPPPQVYQTLNAEHQRQAALASRAQFMHKLRLTNASRQPLTTAPVLIERNGQILAQTLMTYTAPGGQSDIDLSPAVDITLKRSEDEIKRTPNALNHEGNALARMDVSGKLVVTSFRSEPTTIEITRQFVGKVESAGAGALKGTIRQVGAGDDALASGAGAEDRAPAWWSYTGEYWRQVNPISSVTWTMTLPARSSRELPYKYFYFWR